MPSTAKTAKPRWANAAVVIAEGKFNSLFLPSSVVIGRVWAAPSGCSQGRASAVSDGINQKAYKTPRFLKRKRALNKDSVGAITVSELSRQWEKSGVRERDQRKKRDWKRGHKIEEAKREKLNFCDVEKELISHSYATNVCCHQYFKKCYFRYWNDHINKVQFCFSQKQHQDTLMQKEIFLEQTTLHVSYISFLR